MLNIEVFENVVWTDSDHTHFIATVKFKEFDETFEGYGALRNDKSPHVVKMFELLDIGTVKAKPKAKMSTKVFQYYLDYPPTPSSGNLPVTTF